MTTVGKKRLKNGPRHKQWDSSELLSSIPKRWLIGIDEAGRGALAGPVSVGAFCVPIDFDFSVFSIVRDSKQMTPKARERVFEEIMLKEKEGAVRYSVALISERVIDKEGIVAAVRKGIDEVLIALNVAPELVEVRLDGSLKAPSIYRDQQTIIKGDVTEPAISLASIAAKVTRDRKMITFGKKYPIYHFEVHKGYGTKMHQNALVSKGLCVLHRKSFCRRYL